jgi:hypothetical protein
MEYAGFAGDLAQPSPQLIGTELMSPQPRSLYGLPASLDPSFRRPQLVAESHQRRAVGLQVGHNESPGGKNSSERTATIGKTRRVVRQLDAHAESSIRVGRQTRTAKCDLPARDRVTPDET